MLFINDNTFAKICQRIVNDQCRVPELCAAFPNSSLLPIKLFNLIMFAHEHEAARIE